MIYDGFVVVILMCCVKSRQLRLVMLWNDKKLSLIIFLKRVFFMLFRQVTVVPIYRRQVKLRLCIAPSTGKQISGKCLAHIRDSLPPRRSRLKMASGSREHSLYGLQGTEAVSLHRRTDMLRGKNEKRWF